MKLPKWGANVWVGFVLLGVLLLGTVGLFFVGIWVPDAGVEQADRCFRNEDQVPATDAVWAYYDRPNAPPSDVAGKPVQLALLSEQSTTMHFGRSQAVRAMDIDYKLSLQGAASKAGSTQSVDTLRNRLGKTPIQLDLVQFRRSDGATLNPDQVKARGRVVGDRVRITLCIDRRDAEALGGPGTYQGTVSVIDPRIARVDLPILVDASYPHWTRPLALVVLALLAGSWVTWVVKEQKPDTDQFEPAEWAGWMVTAIGIISVVAGAAAAIAVFQATYLSSATWGASMGEFISLLSASFVAFMGATTGLHVATLAERYHRKKTTTGKTASVRTGTVRTAAAKTAAGKTATAPRTRPGSRTSGEG